MRNDISSKGSEPTDCPLDWLSSSLAVGDGDSPDDVFLVELLLIFSKEVQEHSRLIDDCSHQLKEHTSSGPRLQILTTMRQQVHAVKGSASMLKLNKLTRISTELESVLIKACNILDNLTQLQDSEKVSSPSGSGFNSANYNDDSVIHNLLNDYFNEVMNVLHFIESRSYLEKMILSGDVLSEEIIMKINNINSTIFDSSLHSRK
jgi:HPt (histidine-containing phosphotransfer) domain-containing protein